MVNWQDLLARSRFFSHQTAENACIFAVLLAKWLGRLHSINGLTLLQRAKLAGFASPIYRMQHSRNKCFFSFYIKVYDSC